MRYLAIVLLFVANCTQADDNLLGRILIRSHDENAARQAGVPEAEIARSRLYAPPVIQDTGPTPNLGQILERSENEASALRAGVPREEIGRARLYEGAHVVVSPQYNPYVEQRMQRFDQSLKVLREAK